MARLTQAELDRIVEKKRSGKELTRAEVKALEAKWHGKSPNDLMLDDLGLPQAPLSTGKVATFGPADNKSPMVVCSFCGLETPRITATLGQSAPRKATKREQVESLLVETMIHVVDKLVACPACALEIETTTNRKGERNGGGIRFPETEG